MITFKGILPSGVPFEVKEISGKHQRILTAQDGLSFGEKLNTMLADLLVRVGDITGFDEDFVKAMLSADRRYALVFARMKTLEEPDVTPEFRFTYKYLNSEGHKAELELVEDLSKGFNMVPYKNQVTSYAELSKDVRITLPRSGATCIFKLMDGFSEQIGQLTKKADQSSHTPLYMRNPRIIEVSDNKNEVPIQADLDKMGLRDIEALRKAIKEHEGRVDTEMMFEHPEADKKGPDEKNVVIDLLGQLAFFFPSEAI